jgi:WD40 repeat protein
VRSIAFSPDGRLLATAGSADIARLWEIATGSLLRAVTPGPAWDVAFSPDGLVLATAGGRSRSAPGVLAAAPADRAAWLWNIASGEVVNGLAVQGGRADAVAFSPDGQLLATAGAGDVVRLWDVSSGQLVRSLPRKSGLAESIAFSPDGRLLATAGAGGAARLWEVATGRLVRPVTPASASDVAFSPDGLLLATAGGGIRSVPGVVAAAAVDRAAWLWDVATGSLLRRLMGHDDPVQAVAFSPDASMLATSSRDGAARVWNLSSGNSLQLEVSAS